jgi:hypothetical protein
MWKEITMSRLFAVSIAVSLTLAATSAVQPAAADGVDQDAAWSVKAR